MPERIMPGLGLRAFYDPGQRDWGTSVSEDLRALSVLVQARIQSRSTALPASGSVGDIFIVPDAAGANANALALWDGEPDAEGWVFLTPQPGWQVWIGDEARHVRFEAGAWREVPRPGIVPIRTLTVTAHTLELVDTGSIIETTGTSSATVTIPAEASVPFEPGTLINITQVGAGVATVTAAAGVSLNGVEDERHDIAVRLSGEYLTTVAEYCGEASTLSSPSRRPGSPSKQPDRPSKATTDKTTGERMPPIMRMNIGITPIQKTKSEGSADAPFVFLENVAHHLRLDFPEVASGLVGMGYKLAAGLFTAAEVGAPHKRERLFILAIREGDKLADPARLLWHPQLRLLRA